jgi:hypothetical protein
MQACRKLTPLGIIFEALILDFVCSVVVAQHVTGEAVGLVLAGSDSVEGEGLRHTGKSAMDEGGFRDGELDGGYSNSCAGAG